MPILLYVIVIFIVIIAIGLFWFLSGNNNFKTGYEMPPYYDKEIDIKDLFLKIGLKKIELFIDKGKWYLFLIVFMLMVEFMAFIAYFIQNTGTTFNLSGTQHLYFLGGMIYFFLLIFALFLALKIISSSKELPPLNENLHWPGFMLESKSYDLNLNEEQKKRLSFYIIEKQKLLEQNSSLALVLIASAGTILLTWLSIWIFNIA